MTADQGASFRHGSRRRNVSDENVADVLLVPLLVKLPHQTAGAISDSNVETVDVVPTIADVLATTVPYPIDGRSLLDAPDPDRTRKTLVRRGRARVNVVEYPEHLDDPGWEEKLPRFGAGLYGLGPHGSLVGQPLSTHDVATFEDVDPEARTLPLYVGGRLEGGPSEPVSLAVSVNGVIAATTLSYRENGEWVFGSMIPEDALSRRGQRRRDTRCGRDRGQASCCGRPAGNGRGPEGAMKGNVLYTRSLNTFPATRANGPMSSRKSSCSAVGVAFDARTRMRN